MIGLLSLFFTCFLIKLLLQKKLLFKFHSQPLCLYIFLIEFTLWSGMIYKLNNPASKWRQVFCKDINQCRAILRHMDKNQAESETETETTILSIASRAMGQKQRRYVNETDFSAYTQSPKEDL